MKEWIYKGKEYLVPKKDNDLYYCQNDDECKEIGNCSECIYGVLGTETSEERVEALVTYYNERDLTKLKIPLGLCQEGTVQALKEVCNGKGGRNSNILLLTIDGAWRPYLPSWCASTVYRLSRNWKSEKKQPRKMTVKEVSKLVGEEVEIIVDK